MRRGRKLAGRLRFSNWSILAKVMAGPLVMLVALTLMTFVAWQTLKTQRTAIVSGFAEFEIALDRAYHVSHHLASVEANLYKLSMWSEIGVRGAELEGTLRSISYNLEISDTDIAKMQEAGLEGAEELRAAFAVYKQNTSQAVLLILRNATLGAVATRGGHQTYARVERLAQSIATQASSDFREATDRTSAMSDRLARDFIVAAALTGLMAIIVSFAASRVITRPILGLVRTVQSLLRGDLAVAVPFVERRDEFGRIAASVRELQRVMVQNRLLADEREQKQAELEHIASHDGLTAVANRKAFDTFLDAIWQDTQEGGEFVYLLVDLDSFKPINDAYGHDAGDAVLKTLAQRFRELTRPGDFVARLGGDEFGIVVPLADHRRDPETIARRILEATTRPIPFNGRELRVGASIGVACSRDVSGAAHELMAAADQAMYVAKQEKRPSYSVYSPSMMPERFGLEDKEEIETALERGEFVMHYQPKVRLGTDGHAGFEALARWQHPEKGLLPPSYFLPRIGNFGLQGNFTMEVARQVFSDLRRFAAAGLDTGGVAINLDEATLATRSGMDALHGLFAENAEFARLITLEITEDVFIARSADIIRDNVEMLAALGIRISMDDFGTGYGSFKHLREFTIHELKIDTQFVAGIGRDKSSEVIIDGFLAIASGLGADVVAEGIETPEQQQYLTRRGCHFGQGFLFCRPLPFDGAAAYLEERAPLAREKTKVG
ncbi:bifunctional diguanylate cyclase/phosphodiesterase [Stappia sp. MMSF_3263]|uniref:putative bifunctional diguanylate cyclase/phosphodiesterase n=1 Tax=Stappia sp. MMSF_3263 TaxID=3046693 RepID=UPI00273CFD17|nr:bifunctional diguanylate cyclase/phosphodiesterase [Stappia sp. MMSF_3263]